MVHQAGRAPDEDRTVGEGAGREWLLIYRRQNLRVVFVPGPQLDVWVYKGVRDDTTGAELPRSALGRFEADDPNC